MSLTLSRKNAIFEQTLLLTKPAARTETRHYLIEGTDIVSQAIADRSTVIHSVFMTQLGHDILKESLSTRAIVTYIVPPSMITELTGNSYATPCHAVASLDQRRTSVKGLADQQGIILCGECVQDPRNVGVMIRTADALGCHAILLDAQSTDPWARQSVRSTTGSILRVPIAITATLSETLRKLRELGMCVVATTGSTSLSLYDSDLTQRPLAIVMGNEQSGISDATRAAASTLVKIPMAEMTLADSLNVTVAAGITLAEALRQHGAKNKT